MASKKDKEVKGSNLPKTQKDDNVAVIELNAKDLMENVEKVMDSNYNNIKGIDRQFDEIFQLVGITSDSRRSLFNAKKNVKEVPMTAVLGTVVQQLKAQKGVEQTDQEIKDEARAQLEAQASVMA